MPYSKINPKDMILRDHLAYDRTILANETTLLAYLRTAMALLAAGATLFRLFPEDMYFQVLGTVMLILGILIAGIGGFRFLAITKRLKMLHEKVEVEKQG
jgi:putative membrane protein